MDEPRRPEWDATVRLAQTVTVQMERAEAFTHLAAVHEARRLLRGAERGAERAALLDALASLERELGLAIGADAARSFLRARRRAAPR